MLWVTMATGEAAGWRWAGRREGRPVLRIDVVVGAQSVSGLGRRDSASAASEPPCWPTPHSRAVNTIATTPSAVHAGARGGPPLNRS